MTFVPADDYQHEAGSHPRWQETYWLGAWDGQNRGGVSIHLARQPHEGHVATQVTVVTPEGTVSLGGRHPGDDALAIPGLDVDIHAPFEHWTMRYAGAGVRGPNEHGLYAQTPGEVPFGFTLDFHHPLPPHDVGSVYLDRVAKGVTNNQYVAGAVFTGEVWCADHHTPVSGLLTRDHSWGVRNWDFDLGIAAFIALDDAQTFLTPGSFLAGDRWKSFCAIHDKDGLRDLGETWARVDGLPVVGGYRNAAFGIPEVPAGQQIVEITGHAQRPHWSPSVTSGTNMLWLISLSTVRWGDKTGQGTHWTVFPATSPLAANLAPDRGQSEHLPIIGPDRSVPAP
ncbi:hypothetical protein ATK36_2963 [Amycolatopsis sulphurea]|uniref:Tocopherol cyclase-like protein n=1 Tax=Amycolatopsis sulphurea TaxID=76022 RepID=A0A2A9FAU8_9PSEU|nr:hypothetical protein [Amycolatopsis sulphurea]PFG47901.1 hypothetical protein ATK36_2963 [Amycolatopsis sulphurea]